MAILGFLSIYIISFIIFRKCENYSKLIKLSAIVVISILIRMVVMLFIKVTPVSDYGLYYKLSELFIGGGVGHSSYVAYFPHVVGYPFILSKIFLIFGMSVDVAVIFNIICSALTSVFVFKLCMLLLKDEKKSYLAAVIWLMWPSQIFMVLFVATEPIFTFGLVLFAYLIIWVVKKFELELLPSVLSFAVLGLFCALLNALRPIGLIILASSALYLTFMYFSSSDRNRRKLLSAVLSILIMFSVNAFFQKEISSEISKMIKQEVASFPVGFNVFIGTNADSLGMNSGKIEKAKEIFSYGSKNKLSAQEIHDMFLQEGIKNVKKQGLSNIKLFFIKNAIMWLSDDTSLSSIYSMADKEKSVKINDLATIVIIYLLTDLYYLIILLLFAWAIYKKIRKKDFRELCELSFLISLILLSAGLYCIIEVQSRYHYPLLPMFAIIAVNQIDEIKFFKRKRQK